MSRIASISKKFESGVAFSNGWAEFTLKKPPPLVPSCLIAICEAAGPIGSVCWVIGVGLGAGVTAAAGAALAPVEGAAVATAAAVGAGGVIGWTSVAVS